MHTTIAIIVSVFFVTMFGAMGIEQWAKVRLAQVEPEVIDYCVDNGYDTVRMDLIPYAECRCDERQHCYCFPI